MFECELSESGLQVDWLKGDRVLRRSDKYTMTSIGGVHTLTINDCDGKDAGEYSATCKSKVTSAKLSVEGMLLVICKETGLHRMTLMEQTLADNLET